MHYFPSSVLWKITMKSLFWLSWSGWGWGWGNGPFKFKFLKIYLSLGLHIFPYICGQNTQAIIRKTWVFRREASQSPFRESKIYTFPDSFAARFYYLDTFAWDPDIRNEAENIFLQLNMLIYKCFECEGSQWFNMTFREHQCCYYYEEAFMATVLSC